ncbi:MAG: polysaccharide deacetylase family protein [Anaerolineales bacterium]|nr:polysaccharide deacetylase family protein [Anaerolineales bacterium]
MAVLRPPNHVVARFTVLFAGMLLCVFACNCPASAQDEPASPPKVIYLTFDDGPSGYTQPILDTLARYNAKATFFVVGRQAAGNLPRLQAMVDAGHGVANHTYHHPMLTSLSSARIDEEVRATAAVLGVLDQGCLRPPYGAANKTVRAEVESLGYTVIMWTIDPRDWSRPGAATIANRVIQRAAECDCGASRWRRRSLPDRRRCGNNPRCIEPTGVRI